ncbi:YdeI/OmpD-associated family protein [Pedobacter sp. SYP-B3415]|uniref:YdeI/OmpD-associated family protein n=1 Tax=Pedobacter sp. SYP-B3415 TaxID=2496641 RepID=UPI00101D678B|nr:YdeI/OmpD-associated family protein [Pedobacter sp. SYP-B3415]
MYQFKAQIYKTGINWCVDVPVAITARMTPEKGYIHIHGVINGFDFTKTLVPVKNAPYRLFVNAIMMKGGKTALGQVASFEIKQVKKKQEAVPNMHPDLEAALSREGLSAAFGALTAARRRDAIKYLYKVKTDETRTANINTIIAQLRNGEKNVRIPMTGYPLTKK